MRRLNINRKSQTVQFLFTMLLFFVLIFCALTTISFGSRVYKNIEARMNDNFQATTALSYISNKVRQGDDMKGVGIIKVDGINVLMIKEKYETGVYHTFIYY